MKKLTIIKSVIILLVFASCNQVRQASTEMVEFDASSNINGSGAFDETMTLTDDEVRGEFESELGDWEGEDVIGISAIQINSIKLRFDVKSDNETNSVNVYGTLTTGSFSGTLFDEDNFLINRTGLFDYATDNLHEDAVKKIQEFCINLYNKDGIPQDLDPLIFNVIGEPADDPAARVSTDIYVVVVLQTGVEFCITVPPFMGGEPCGDFGIYWPFPFL